MDVVEGAREQYAQQRGKILEEEVTIFKVDQGRNNRCWLHAKRDNGEKIILNLLDHYPYMYVEPEADITHESVVNIEGPFHSVTGQELKKVTVKSPLDVRELRTLAEHPHEADIPYTQNVIRNLDCLGRCRIRAAHVENNEYVVKCDGIEHLTHEVDVTRLDVVYYDIEVATDGKGAIPGLDGNAQDPIIAITTYDPAREEWIVWNYHPQNPISGHRKVRTNTLGEVEILHQGFRNERDMLKSFCTWYRERQPDAFAGWYSNGFDAPYITNRLSGVGLSRTLLGHHGYVDASKWGLNWPGTQLLDLIDARRKMSFGKNKKNDLKTVAAELCDIHLEKEPGNILKWWREDIESLVEYNVRDVEATWRIDEKAKYSEFSLSFMFLTFVDAVSDIWKASIVHDVNLLRYSRGRVVQPMKPPKPEKGKEKGYKGAIVQDPQPGLHRNVGVFDFTSLYPACIVAGNISPETLCKDPDCPENHFVAPEVGHRFHTDVQGIMPEITLDLWNKKRYYDERKLEVTGEEKGRVERLRWPVKITLNALYGVSGYPGFRGYVRECAESVTALARFAITQVVEYLRDEKYLVAYGDTDSAAPALHAKTVEAAVEEGKRLVPILEAVTQEAIGGLGARNTRVFSLNFEKVYSALLVAPRKKRYAGLVAWDEGEFLDPPKLSVAGFEIKRSDAPALSVRLQERALTDLLNGKTTEEIMTYVNEEYAAVRDGKRPIHDVAPTPTITKEFDEYASAHYAAEAAKYSNEYLGTRFRVDDRLFIAYISTVPTNYPQVSQIALHEEMAVPEGFYVDWARHADVAVRKKMETIMEAVGASVRLEAVGNMTLADFY